MNKNSNDRVDELEEEVKRLKREITELFHFFSELEVDIAFQDLMGFTSSNKYFKNLLNSFISESKNRSKLQVSKEMGVSQGRLYEIINGKRAITDRTFKEIKNVLSLSEDQYLKLEFLIKKDKESKKKFKHLLSEKLSNQLSPERAKMKKTTTKSRKHLSSWMHFAILSIFKIKDIVPTREWIAKKLAIDIEVINPIIDSLLEAECLKEESGVLEYSFFKRSFSNASSDEERENFKNITIGQIHKALEAYESYNLPFENRDKLKYGGYFFTGDSSRLEQAGKMLDESLAKIANYLSEGDNNDQLYSMSYQLVPLIKPDES